MLRHAKTVYRAICLEILIYTTIMFISLVLAGYGVEVYLLIIAGAAVHGYYEGLGWTDDYLTALCLWRIAILLAIVVPRAMLISSTTGWAVSCLCLAALLAAALYCKRRLPDGIETTLPPL